MTDVKFLYGFNFTPSRIMFLIICVFFVFLFKVITKEANVRVKVIPKRNGGYIEGRSREAGVIPSRSGY